MTASVRTSRPIIECARAQALFVSDLQPHDLPSVEQVRATIAAAIRRYGVRGCLARVAEEYGEHPETAVARMRWARETAERAYGPTAARPTLAAA
jgi:hypothetical protein